MAVTGLKAALDKVFSQFIRLRDSDDNGYITCYCCSKKVFWKEAHNMHYIPRQHLSLRFSEVNCHAGCVRCNYFNNGNIEQYIIHLKKDFGEDINERLVLAKNQKIKISEAEYKVMITHYKSEVRKLRNQKGLLK